MLIDKLELKNFRGFSDLTVDFNSLQTVILGENGSGKSSVLDALRFVLNEAIREILKFGSYVTPPNITKWDTKNGEMTGKIIITSNGIQYELDVFNHMLAYLKPVNHSKFWDAWRSSNNFPVILYYDTNSFTTTTAPESIEDNWFENITNQANILISFIKWFGEENDLENTLRLEQDNQYRNPNLQNIRIALNKFLGLLFENKGTEPLANLRIKKTRGTNGLAIENYLIINKGDVELNLIQLSSGEKRILLLAADIAKSLAMSNPDNANPLLGEGIVLIDELDNHLHPRWQANILGALRQTFPNIQFIVTTHSPHIISRIHKEDIVYLDNFKTTQFEENTYGRDIENILFNVFGIERRPHEIGVRLQNLFRLIELDKNDEAKALLKELIADLGDNDPDLIQAAVILDEYH